MSGILNFEGSSYDLSSLVNINLNYNFDILKQALESLIKAQKVQAIKMVEFEDNLKRKDKKIEELEYKQNLMKKDDEVTKRKSYDSMEEDLNNERNENNTNIKELKKTENDKQKEITSDVDDEKENKYEVIHDNSDLLKQFQNLKIKHTKDITNLNSKTSLLEKKIVEFLSSKDKELKLTKSNSSIVNECKEKVEDHSEIIAKIESSIEEINGKLLDFNIYDLFKSNTVDTSNTSGNSDKTMLLIQNLEQKTLKKFESCDEKIKKNLDEQYKFKKELTKITIKISEIKEKQSIDSMILSDNKLELDKIMEIIDDKINNLNSSITNKINDLKKLKEDNIVISKPDDKEALNKSINYNLNKSISESEMKQFKEINKKIMDIEKTFRHFTNSIDKDQIYDQIRILNEKMNYKVGVIDFNEYKEILNQNTNQILFLTESVNQIVEDRKIFDDFHVIKKRVENIQNTLASIKHNENSHHDTIQSKASFFDYSKYLELTSFYEFQRNFNKELESTRSRIEDTKRLIDDIISELKVMVKDKDLKNLEDIFISKIDDMKISLPKRYAEKNEMIKNVKYLETEIKHFVEIYSKKVSDKSDNWLIAKKPIGNFTCASCENFIGDLQDKNQFVPWNKVPQRDPSDRLYRIGNGFSRMLQLINLESNQNNSIEGDLTRDLTKLNIKSNRNTTGNDTVSVEINTENFKTDPNNLTIDDGFKPKIVKIYKKVNKATELDK